MLIKKHITLLFIFVGAISTNNILIAQQSDHVDLIFQWNPDTIPGIFNDLWGYEAPDGKEYAIVGTSQYVYFWDITDTSNIFLADQHKPGYHSDWRDFKTYDHYAYGVTDQGTSQEGLLIYDLMDLPDSVRFVKAVTSDFLRAHNIFIDTLNAKLYACGTNTHSQGMVVYDISDPENPLLLGTPRLDQDPNGPAPGDGYVHDLYVRDDTVYASHGYDGFWIWDFNNAANPSAIGGIDQGPGYNHSSWVTGDGAYAIFAEELPSGQPLAVTDLADFENPDIVHTFKEPLLAPTHTNNVPHNPYIKDSFLYVSYYEDGVQIWDISDPLNPIKTGYYDTEPNNTTYNGTTRNWGVFPFLKQDKIIATDTENGFFVLQFADKTALPLSLISFEVEMTHHQATVQWSTIDAYAVSHFILQRSKNGIDFTDIARLEAVNSHMIQPYTYVDQSSGTNRVFYRLLWIDVDGTEYYSNVISTQVASGQSLSIYPNPSRGVLYVDASVDITNRYHYKMYSLEGRLLMANPITEGTIKLPAQIYIAEQAVLLQLYNNNSLVKSQKILLNQTDH